MKDYIVVSLIVLVLLAVYLVIYIKTKPRVFRKSKYEPSDLCVCKHRYDEHTPLGRCTNEYNERKHDHEVCTCPKFRWSGKSEVKSQ